ncbi:MAG: site-2 protease family protein [Desulfohalobiaceae bacterium]
MIALTSMFDPASFLQQLAILAVPVLMAITFHEVAHGYVAYILGDPTAKNAGRLTLNPIKHLDPIGTIALFLVKVGWAKPVPVNPNYFLNPRQGMILVSVAGPAANFILAVLFSLLFHSLVWFVGTNSGSSSASGLLQPVLYMAQAGVLVNIGLGVFNLLPVPPLDGSNILAGILPPQLAQSYMQISKYGFIILILLILTGAVQKVVLPVIYTLASWLLPM